MKGRIFLLAAAQAIRAAVTALIPISLISIFGWASAGSDSGNTGDGLRGAGIIWLASHHVLFSVHLQSSDVIARFWFLPLGLLVIPYFTLRGAGLRTARELRGQGVENLLFASLSLVFSYSVLVTAMAAIVRTVDVQANPIASFAGGFVTTLMFAVPRILEVNWPAGVRVLVSAVRSSLIFLLSLGALAVVVLLVINFSELLNVLTVLRLGLISGGLVSLLSLAYLPNLAVWAIAYASGAGFGFGTGSLVAPWTTSLASVPAFPLFAAIPAEPWPYAIYLPTVLILTFLVVGFRRFQIIEYSQAWLVALKFAGMAAVITFALAGLSGGPLFGGKLSAVGPSLWKFPLIVGAESFVGVLVGVLVRTVLGRIRPRHRLRRA